MANAWVLKKNGRRKKTQRSTRTNKEETKRNSENRKRDKGT
jgi:hypothetical protein